MSANSENLQIEVKEVNGGDHDQIEQMLAVQPLSKEELTQVQDYGAGTVSSFIKNGVQGFDYSEKSVKFLSEVIDREGPTYSERAKNMLPTLWGAYYGEALLKRYQGNWVKLGDGSYSVKLKNGYVIKPMLRLDKHISFGHKEAIYAQYLTIEKVEAKTP
ncbi:hypothetical protein ACJJIE_01690 [Microbulbifer sp. TRSA001]|uniref:hypothetical protein n=1 Tax=Microbulbifer sp. TRSA001 TaxID=3243381 RepID=UPI0040396EF7